MPILPLKKPTKIGNFKTSERGFSARSAGGGTPEPVSTAKTLRASVSYL